MLTEWAGEAQHLKKQKEVVSKILSTQRYGETEFHRVLFSNFTFSVKLKHSVTLCLNFLPLRQSL